MLKYFFIAYNWGYFDLPGLFPFQWPRSKTHVNYRQFSNVRGTQSQNINVSRLVLLLSLPNPLKPGVKLRMKM